MKPFKLDKHNILLLLVAGLSIVSSVQSFNRENYASIVVSLIGLAGVALFFMNKDAFRYCIWLWIAAQAIIIEHSISGGGLSIDEPILDFSQVVQLKFGVYVSSEGSGASINFNFLVILYFFLFRRLKTTSYIGKSINLLVMKGNHDISYQEGTCATLTERINLNGDDSWLLGVLSAPIVYNQQSIDRVLVRTEDGLLTHTFRLVTAGMPLMSGMNPLLQFERAEWLMIE